MLFILCYWNATSWSYMFHLAPDYKAFSCVYSELVFPPTVSQERPISSLISNRQKNRIQACVSCEETKASENVLCISVHEYMFHGNDIYWLFSEKDSIYFLKTLFDVLAPQTTTLFVRQPMYVCTISSAQQQWYLDKWYCLCNEKYIYKLYNFPYSDSSDINCAK